MLKRKIGARLVVHRKGGCIGGLGRGVGPDPLADRHVPVPVIDVHLRHVVAPIVPQTRAVGARSPVGIVHAREGHVRCIRTVVDGGASRPVFKRPVVDEVRWFRGRVRGYKEGRCRDGRFAGVWALPREDESVRTAALEEFDSEFVQAFGEVQPSRALSHAVHSVIFGEGGAVDPQFRAVVGIDEEGPISCIGYVDESAESSAPMLLKSVVETCIGVV